MATVKFRSSCDTCLATKVKCSQTKPSCARCIQHRYECVYSPYRKIGRPSHKAVSALALQPRDAGPRLIKAQRQRMSPFASGVRASKAQKNSKTQPGGDHTSPIQRQGSSRGDHASIHVGVGVGVGLRPKRFQRNTSTNDDTAVLDDHTSAHDLFATFGGGMDYGLESMNWSHLSNIIDLPAAPPPRGPNDAEKVDISPEGPHLGGRLLLTSTVAGPKVPTLSPVPSLEDPGPTSPSRAFHGSSPSDSRQSPVAVLQPSPHHTPAPELEGFLFPGLVSVFPGGNNLTLTGSLSSRPLMLGGQAYESPWLFSGTTLPGSCEPKLYHIPDSRCTLRCHANLTKQLGDISECQASNLDLTLDALLRLDSHIWEARNKVLSCASCLASSRCGSTLMLIAMVVGNLLHLFERRCSTDTIDDDKPGVNFNLDESFGTTEGRQNPTISISSTGKRSMAANGPLGSLPSTRRHLSVNKGQLDETIKMDSSRRLLRMYLDRQQYLVQHLYRILTEADGGDVSCKVTGELLKDVTNRLGRFTVFLALADTRESSYFHRILT